MFYAVSTKNGFEVTPHATEEMAGLHLINSLNGDFSDSVWLEGSTLKMSDRRGFDFSLDVFDGEQSLIESVVHFDSPAVALRAIADAIEAGERL